MLLIISESWTNLLSKLYIIIINEFKQNLCTINVLYSTDSRNMLITVIRIVLKLNFDFEVRLKRNNTYLLIIQLNRKFVYISSTWKLFISQ